MTDDETREYQRQVREARSKLHALEGGNEGDAPAPRRGRLSLSEVIEMLLARNATEHSSVSLSRNSKGETQIEVTVRTEQAAGITTVEEASAKALEVYDLLRARYPMSTGNVGAQPPPAEPAPQAAASAEPVGGSLPPEKS